MNDATGSRAAGRPMWQTTGDHPTEPVMDYNPPEPHATRDRAADTIARPVIAEADALRVALGWFFAREAPSDLDRAAYESIRDTLFEQGIIS